MTVSIELWRAGIAALAKWACGYEKGRGKLEAPYVEVTEGRDTPKVWAHYSSCADLAHWLAERCGVTDPWVNRTHDDVNGPWANGVNVSRLMGSGIAKTPVGSYLPGAGDIMILFNSPDGHDAHVCVYLGPNPEKKGEHITANYGAGGMSNSEHPGAKLGSKPLRVEGATLMYGAKRVQRVIEAPALAARSTRKPDFSGPEYDADFTGEVQDALAAVHDAP